MSSRLFQNIREKQGLAYSIYSDLNPYRDTGCLSVYAGTSRESAVKLVESVVAEFRKLKTEEVLLMSCAVRKTSSKAAWFSAWSRACPACLTWRARNVL